MSIFRHLLQSELNRFDRPELPTYHFPLGEKRISFDFNIDTILDILDQINANRGYKLIFDTKNHGQIAIGDGATRQVYNKIIIDFIDLFMMKIEPYFIDIPLENDYWNSVSNIECFVFLVGMAISSESLLPYHFKPALLEQITNKKMTLEELEFYMNIMDPVSLANAKKILPENFALLGTDFDTHEDFYRSIVIGQVPEIQMTVYKKIGEAFQFFDSFYNFDIKTVDISISGFYTITSQMILPNMEVTPTEYMNMWKEFISSLNETELRNMLILFSNTHAVDNKFRIIVKDKMNEDINIATCFKKIILNKKLFESKENLHNLRMYFMDNTMDEISDERPVARLGNRPILRTISLPLNLGGGLGIDLVVHEIGRANQDEHSDNEDNGEDNVENNAEDNGENNEMDNEEEHQDNHHDDHHSDHSDNGSEEFNTDEEIINEFVESFEPVESNQLEGLASLVDLHGDTERDYSPSERDGNDERDDAERDGDDDSTSDPSDEEPNSAHNLIRDLGIRIQLLNLMMELEEQQQLQRAIEASLSTN